jgi:hypothetical protein
MTVYCLKIQKTQDIHVHVVHMYLMIEELPWKIISYMLVVISLES